MNSYEGTGGLRRQQLRARPRTELSRSASELLSLTQGGPARAIPEKCAGKPTPSASRRIPGRRSCSRPSATAACRAGANLQSRGERGSVDQSAAIDRAGARRCRLALRHGQRARSAASRAQRTYAVPSRARQRNARTEPTPLFAHQRKRRLGVRRANGTRSTCPAFNLNRAGTTGHSKIVAPLRRRDGGHASGHDVFVGLSVSGRAPLRRLANSPRLELRRSSTDLRALDGCAARATRIHNTPWNGTAKAPRAGASGREGACLRTARNPPRRPAPANNAEQ